MKSPNGLRIVFFGTPDFAVHVLEHLKEADLLPALIVTTPDKPQGRNMVVTKAPTKVWAEAHTIEVIQPETLRKNLPDELTKNVWDLFIVASYGKIIPKAVLDIPKHGTLNVHPSLLPKLRGASPIESAILTDAKQTGVTIMLLDEELDHGPIIAQASVEVEDLPDQEAGWPPKASELSLLLSQVGGALLVETILPWINGDITPEIQDHSQATFTKKIEKEDGLLDLISGDPYQNYLKIKAFDIRPGTFFFVKKGSKELRVKIIDATYENGVLTITRVIPEGKKEMDYADFKRGLR